MIGMPTIMPKVMRSRLQLQELLEDDAPPARDREALSSRRPEVVGRPLGQVDEHVLEAGLGAAATRQPVPARRARAASPRAPPRRGRSRAARSRRRRPARRPARRAAARRSPRRSSPVTAQVVRPWPAMISCGRALRHQPAVGDVGELVAALGLVHVVRADQHRDAARGERVQLLPELAARLGIDAGGRLVEQQQLGLVQHARGERQALLPAARERPGELAPRGRRGPGRRARGRPPRGASGIS